MKRKLVHDFFIFSSRTPEIKFSLTIGNLTEKDEWKM